MLDIQRIILFEFCEIFIILVYLDIVSTTACMKNINIVYAYKFLYIVFHTMIRSYLI
jgi:hypothetical protein